MFSERELRAPYRPNSGSPVEDVFGPQKRVLGRLAEDGSFYFILGSFILFSSFCFSL